MSSELVVIGLSYRSSPVEVRERLAVGGDALVARVADVSKVAESQETLLLSTCNRVEVYLGADEADPRLAERVRRWLDAAAGEPLGSYVYERHGADAVKHAFRVAASLDSMVVGEPQILGQVKDAYAAARASGTLGSLLDRCFTTAFAVAKRVRTETGIAAGSVSVSSIACDLAKKIFGDLGGRRVLLVGAGKMGESAAKHLRKQGASLFVANRSRERAEALAAACGGSPRAIEELAAELALADVAIASTASPRFVITPELMRGVMKARRHRPLFLIDIAVPRDVDPRVGELDNVFVYDVDDLEKVAQENLSVRRREADKAERIVTLEVEGFEKWRRASVLKPTIVGLRERVRATLMAELERTLPRLSNGEADKQALERMVDAMVNKLLHAPIAQLKAGAEGADGAALVDATR